MTSLDRFYQLVTTDPVDGGGRSFGRSEAEELVSVVSEHGALDHAMIDALRRAIFRGGDPSVAYLPRIEAELLFSLNELSVDRANNWQLLFVEGIAAHVLNDAGSGGEIDSEEAEWLIRQIENDKQYDANEIALLESLLEQADRIPQALRFRLGMVLSVAHGGR